MNMPFGLNKLLLSSCNFTIMLLVFLQPLAFASVKKEFNLASSTRCISPNSVFIVNSRPNYEENFISLSQDKNSMFIKDSFNKQHKLKLSYPDQLKYHDPFDNHNITALIEMVEEVEKMDSLSEFNKDLLLKLINPIKRENHTFAVFNSLVDDIYTVTSVENQFIAIYEDLGNEPLAKINAILVYLNKKNIIKLAFKDLNTRGALKKIGKNTKLLVTVNGEENELTLSKKTLNFIKKQKRVKHLYFDQAFMLKILQRELLGQRDENYAKKLLLIQENFKQTVHLVPKSYRAIMEHIVRNKVLGPSDFVNNVWKEIQQQLRKNIHDISATSFVIHAALSAGWIENLNDLYGFISFLNSFELHGEICMEKINKAKQQKKPELIDSLLLSIFENTRNGILPLYKTLVVLAEENVSLSNAKEFLTYIASKGTIVYRKELSEKMENPAFWQYQAQSRAYKKAWDNYNKKIFEREKILSASSRKFKEKLIEDLEFTAFKELKDILKAQDSARLVQFIQSGKLLINEAAAKNLEKLRESGVVSTYSDLEEKIAADMANAFIKVPFSEDEEYSERLNQYLKDKYPGIYELPDKPLISEPSPPVPPKYVNNVKAELSFVKEMCTSIRLLAKAHQISYETEGYIIEFLEKVVQKAKNRELNLYAAGEASKAVQEAVDMLLELNYLVQSGKINDFPGALNSVYTDSNSGYKKLLQAEKKDHVVKLLIMIFDEISGANNKEKLISLLDKLRDANPELSLIMAKLVNESVLKVPLAGKNNVIANSVTNSAA